MMMGIALVGLTLAFGSNAWADNGRGGKGQKNDKSYHQSYKTPQGHHYGWQKGKGNPHKDRYQHRPEYRHRDRHPQRRVVEKHVYHHYPRQNHRVVEKHVYHHYPKPDRHRVGHFNIAVSVIDRAFGVAVAGGGRR
jgi:hypothetical protein